MFRKSPQFLPLLTLLCAAVLLFCAWLLPMPDTVKLVLCLVSFLCAFWPLALPAWQDLRQTRRPGYLLLLAAACLLCIFAGAPLAGAGAMLLYRLALLVLEWRRSRTAQVVSTRRSLAELGKDCADFAPEGTPDTPLGRFLQLWLPYIMLILAGLATILSALLTDKGAAYALRRAAMLLVLGNTLPLFYAFGLCDYASAVCAAEQGVVIRDGVLDRLCSAKLCCLQPEEGLLREGDRIVSVIPEQLPPMGLLELAASAWSCSPSPLSDTLSDLLGRRPDPMLLEKYQELRDFGVLAMVGETVVISGSAEYMQRAGLPLSPFRDGKQTVHVGVNGRYAGCIRLDQPEPEETELEKATCACGLYRFRDPEQAADVDPDETLLYASEDGDRSPAGENGIYAALGGFGADAEISTVAGGRRAILQVLKALLNDKSARRLCFLPALILKGVLLLLALVGICPVWVSVLAEAVLTAASCSVAQQALNTEI